MHPPTNPPDSLHGLAWRLLGAAVLIALAWELRQTLVLLFGAVLTAVVLHALAMPLRRLTHLGEHFALTIVLLGLLGLATAAVWWFGEPISQQVRSLLADLPNAWDALRRWLDGSTLGSALLDSLHDVSSPALPLGRIAGAAEGAAQMLTTVFGVLIMGAYLAFDVQLYKRGLVRLLPLPSRKGFAAALDESGQSLMHWLVGQFITMLIIGVLVATGLHFLGLPLALVLGLIAGALEFVPFLGPIAAGMLTVLVAFTQGPQTALQVGLLFLVIQQLEGNVLTPLVQRSAISLPPVLSVASVLVFGTLFGLPGVVFGTPLVVVLMVLVRSLWVEQTLEAGPA